MSPSRRQVLLGAPAALLGLAGCSDAAGPTRADRATGADPGTVRTRDRGTVRDPAVVKPRNLDGGPVIVDPGAEGRRSVGRELVGDRSRAAELAFAPGVPREHVRSARAFLDATDFSAESIYVSHAHIEACYRFRIHSVTWDRPRRRVEFEYCRELRPPDVHCRADARETVGIVFRIPTPLDLGLRGSGSSGRSPCRGSDREWGVIHANATGEGR